MYRILIAEDNKAISNLIKTHLSFAGYDTSQVYDGEFALEILEAEPFDLLILDLMLPKVSGVDILARVKDCQMPIIVVTALDDLSSKVQCLQVGADDYITKPFDPEEVIARVEAAMRRYTKEAQNMEAEQEVFRYKNLSLYPQSRKVEVSGIELPLTMHEYDILYLLIQNPQKVYSREHLYEQVWKGGYYGEDNTVNVHVSNLRKKIQKADKEESYIKTVWGIGFKLG